MQPLDDTNSILEPYFKTKDSTYPSVDIGIRFADRTEADKLNLTNYNVSIKAINSKSIEVQYNFTNKQDISGYTDARDEATVKIYNFDILRCEDGTRFVHN